MAPKPVCLSWAHGQESGLVVGLLGIKEWINHWLCGTAYYESLIVGQNVAYDFACLLQHIPELSDKIWRAYREDRVTCTEQREKLLDIATGEFTTKEKSRYSLAGMVKRKFGITLDKSEEGWRKRFAELDGLPIEKWPAEAVDYAMMDAKTTLLVVHEQEQRAAKIGYSMPTQYMETRASLALKVTSNWGILTDSIKVDALEKKTAVRSAELLEELQASTLIRKDGSKNTKILKTLIEQNYPGPVPCTDPSGKYPNGQTKTSAVVVEECNQPILNNLTEYTKLEKLQSTYISKLHDPIVHAGYAAVGAVTDRTSSFQPNLENQPRDPGVRECFVPRPGCVFISCDYDCQEMRTFAQTCLDIFGHSSLAEQFQANKNFDPHLKFAAEALLGITVKEALKLKKEKNPDFKKFRQRAKASNFGFPGGMGAKTFVAYARGYEATFTIEEAEQIKKTWYAFVNETSDYFRHINTLVGQMGEGTQTYPRSGLRRAGIGYCDAANGYFQGLAAHISKAALFEVAVKCYTDKKSWLYGSRPVVFVHDEIIIETQEEWAHEAAKELEQVMVDAMQVWTPDVPAAASATIMRYWSKEAEETYNSTGRLIPWEGKNES